MSRPATTAAIHIIERNRLWSLLLPATVCLTDGSCAIWRHTQGSIIIISCIAIFWRSICQTQPRKYFVEWYRRFLSLLLFSGSDWRYATTTFSVLHLNCRPRRPYLGPGANQLSPWRGALMMLIIIRWVSPPSIYPPSTKQVRGGLVTPDLRDLLSSVCKPQMVGMLLLLLHDHQLITHSSSSSSSTTDLMALKCNSRWASIEERYIQ